MYKFDVVDGHLTNVQYDDNDDFYCPNNHLITLEGCPEVVNGNFDCSDNSLTSLAGCPKEVKGWFDCYGNKLTSLKGSPEIVNGSFRCSCNHLTSLAGCPEFVKGDFNCYYNTLTSLEGCPKVVNGYFDCSFNSNLEDISDLSVGVKLIYIQDCPNIKVFPRHIKDTLQFICMSKEVLKRLKQQNHLEIVEEGLDSITVREKPANQVFLDTV